MQLLFSSLSRFTQTAEEHQRFTTELEGLKVQNCRKSFSCTPFSMTLEINGLDARSKGSRLSLVAFEKPAQLYMSGCEEFRREGNSKRTHVMFYCAPQDNPDPTLTLLSRHLVLRVSGIVVKFSSLVALPSASHQVSAGGGSPVLVWQLHALRLQPGSRQLTCTGLWAKAPSPPAPLAFTSPCDCVLLGPLFSPSRGFDWSHAGPCVTSSVSSMICGLNPSRASLCCFHAELSCLDMHAGSADVLMPLYSSSSSTISLLGTLLENISICFQFFATEFIRLSRQKM